MYHVACKVEFQSFNRSYSQLTFSNFLSNVPNSRHHVLTPSFYHTIANTSCIRKPVTGGLRRSPLYFICPFAVYLVCM